MEKVKERDDFTDLDLFHLRCLPKEVIMERLGKKTWGGVRHLYCSRGVGLGKRRISYVKGSVKERNGMGMLIVPARLGSSGCRTNVPDEVFELYEECPFKDECKRQFESWGVMGCEEVDWDEVRVLGGGVRGEVAV